MIKKIKQLWAVLVGAILLIGFSSAIPSEAMTTLNFDDVCTESWMQSWTQIDDLGYFMNPNNTDSNDYAVFEQVSSNSVIPSSKLTILSQFRYCQAQIKVTDLDLFEEVYEEYADALQFDAVEYSSSSYGSYITLYNTDADSLAISDEKLALLTDMTADLEDLGILSTASYAPVFATRGYAQCNLELKVSLPYEDAEALNEICSQLGTEIAYYGDVDAYFEKCKKDDEMESLQSWLQFPTEEQQEAYMEKLLTEIESLEQQISEVSEEDSQFAIFSDSFTSQIALLNAIEDAFPDVDASFYIEYPCGVAWEIFKSFNLIELAEANDDDDDSDTYTDPIDIICGDVNFDGSINMADVVTLSKASSGVVDVTDNMTAAGDIDGDGEISESDSLVLLNFEMGLVRAIPLTTNT